jgi:hypothetical protein
MKEFFLILFFAKSVMLSDAPGDILGEVDLSPDEPVSAITSGAHLRLDLTEQLKGRIDLADSVAVLAHLERMYPQGTVSGRLLALDGQEFLLDRSSGATDGKSAELLLSASSGLPTGLDFSRVWVTSSIPLYGVTVTWQNHAK